jgi:hypothetical protein
MILTHSQARLDTIDPWPCDALWTNICRTRRALQITVHQGASRDVMRRLPPTSTAVIRPLM